MDPADIARQVLEAIREERFYVITHDFNGYIEQRLKNVLTSQNLELQEPPKEFSNIYQELIEQEDMK